MPAILRERGLLDSIWLTVEQGMHNGQLLDGDLFGAARHPDAMLSALDQFDFYSGGGIDVACLGMAEMDAQRNVDVSRLGGRIVGPGGFVDIAQNARKVVFCGAFEAKGLACAATGDGLRIDAPGGVRKLRAQVEEITFSGAVARASGQGVLYVTLRAVLALGPRGVELRELAPGVDLARDVLARMEFRPAMPQPPAPMARRHFALGRAAAGQPRSATRSGQPAIQASQRTRKAALWSRRQRSKHQGSPSVANTSSSAWNTDAGTAAPSGVRTVTARASYSSLSKWRMRTRSRGDGRANSTPSTLASGSGSSSG